MIKTYYFLVGFYHFFGTIEKFTMPLVSQELFELSHDEKIINPLLRMMIQKSEV